MIKVYPITNKYITEKAKCGLIPHWKDRPHVCHGDKYSLGTPIGVILCNRRKRKKKKENGNGKEKRKKREERKAYNTHGNSQEVTHPSSKWPNIA